jgi:hypothetical protein
MSITYTYEIISVDAAARCMEVVYTAEGYPTMHIGARLPYVGEALEAVVRMYAPVALWLEQAAVVVPPSVGVRGQVVPSESPTPDPATLARIHRDQLLQSSDKEMLADLWATKTLSQQAAWATYRQALRDLPNQPNFPSDISWPIKPT